MTEAQDKFFRETLDRMIYTPIEFWQSEIEKLRRRLEYMKANNITPSQADWTALENAENYLLKYIQKKLEGSL